MTIRPVAIVAVSALCCLTGCHKFGSTIDQGGSRGRYTGVGVFPASELWRNMIVKGQPKDAAAATTSDDSHIIVVVDSHSGEIRECGEMSGRCVSMNPWTQAIAKEQSAPVALAKHGAELDDHDSGGVPVTNESDLSDTGQESAKAK